MVTKARKVKRQTSRVSTERALRQEQLDELRKIRRLEQTIATEGRAIVRAADAADRRLEHFASIYAERRDKVMVDRAAWDAVRAEHTAMRLRLEQIDGFPGPAPRELVGASER